jgi:hypothetical protein
MVAVPARGIRTCALPHKTAQRVRCRFDLKTIAVLKEKIGSFRGDPESSIRRAAPIGAIVQTLKPDLYRAGSISFEGRFVLYASDSWPSDHSSSRLPSPAPVLMLAISFTSFSLIGIGAQASGPRVQIMMPFFEPS